MKRAIILFIISSFLLTSCLGNASLWGQYQTPTAVGGISDPPTVVSQESATDVPTAINMPKPETIPTATVTPAVLNIFVKQNSTPSTENPLAPTNAEDTVLYYAQSGDWLPAVANRFGVSASEITSPKPISDKGYLDPGTLLIIPDRLDKNVPRTSSLQIVPDSEVVFSAAAMDFDINDYVQQAGGYLSTYREYLGTTAWTTGAEGIQRLAYENSINPRLLLGILDYEARWVRGKPENQFRTDYPLGHENYRNKGMFEQMTWAINQLSIGYYGWRTGQLTELVFRDGYKMRIDPTLNAGTVAILYLFSREHSLNEWLRIVNQDSGFGSFYQKMFGDAWARADALGNLFPPALSQPEMVLPIDSNVTWAFTGGPHSAWGTDGPLAALDFAPRNDKSGCVPTTTWVVALASGLVVRSGNGVVVIDMDGDGSEQTGWDIMYLHIATQGRVPKGQWVDQNDHIGHASCEGGIATGTHTHIARKYNGEWMLADGPVPFVLSGWTVVAGDKPYLGKLVKGNKVVTADVYGQAWSLITRGDEN